MTDTQRVARLVTEAIDIFSLSLSNQTVYTEAATGAFASTAPIAAAAGADTVYAITDDSPYGTRKEAIDATRSVCDALGVEDRIIFPERKREADISNADVITNTGFVRPITTEVISWMSPDTAVPLMYEPWEYRSDDIDIEGCWDAGIPVVGTAENHEHIRTFEYIGHATMKVAYEAGLELLNCTFVVIGGGSVAAEVATVLERSGAEVVVVSPTINDDRIARWRSFESLEALASDSILDTADGLIVAEHQRKYEIIGPSSSLEVATIAARNPSLRLIHLCGNVDTDTVSDSKLNVYPADPRPPGYMTFNAGYVGPRPIVLLHTAGLTIGKELVDTLRVGENFRTATDRVTNRAYALDFSDEFKYRNGYFDGS